jgi:hypothetical protein
MDILEAHFLKSKTTSRLYFRVDLSDEIENSSVKLNLDEAENSHCKSCVNKTFELDQMEEIDEINNVIQYPSRLQEENKLGDESLIVERSNRFEK